MPMYDPLARNKNGATNRNTKKQDRSLRETPPTTTQHTQHEQANLSIRPKNMSSTHPAPIQAPPPRHRIPSFPDHEYLRAFPLTSSRVVLLLPLMTVVMVVFLLAALVGLLLLLGRLPAVRVFRRHARAFLALGRRRRRRCTRSARTGTRW